MDLYHVAHRCRREVSRPCQAGEPNLISHKVYQATPKVIRKLTRNVSGPAVDIQPVLRRFGGNLQPGTQLAQGAGEPKLISHKVFLKSFYISHPPHRSVNLSFTVTNVKNTMTDLCGNRLVKNDFMNTFYEIKKDCDRAWMGFLSRFCARSVPDDTKKESCSNLPARRNRVVIFVVERKGK